MITIGDALTVLGKQEDVDPDRIGRLGFSLGSYLSLSVASPGRPVSAVVDSFGGLPGLFSWNLQRFPPTLILHGDADTSPGDLDPVGGPFRGVRDRPTGADGVE